MECVLGHLKGLLAAEGAGVAFGLLENLSEIDSDVRRESHPVAHGLGRYAFDAYGSIQLAMEECSYRVFAGCFHGALEAYFSSLHDVTLGAIRGLCPEDNDFREYTCLHGVGHGLMLQSRNDLNGSLDMCSFLPGDFARASCYGGAFMQNIVGYLESRSGTVGHEHGSAHDHGGPLVYLVDAADPSYPCNAVESPYQKTCWLIQTSLILHFNGGDFRATAQVCEEEPDGHQETCFRSYGRDVGARTRGDVARAVVLCGHPSSDAWRGVCIEGFVANAILRDADPGRGLAVCAQVPEGMQAPCYRQTGVKARIMLETKDDVAALCDQVPEPYSRDCRSGGRVE
jgi:hypothetical protein